MKAVTPDYLLGTKTGKNFPGSMGPKIEAAVSFVQRSIKKAGVWAAIGDLKDAAKIASNEEGTLIRNNVEGNVVWREASASDDEQAAASSYKPPRQSKDPPKYG
jgi:carbamate kinase